MLLKIAKMRLHHHTNGPEGYNRTIDTHIKNLHQKIAEHLPDKDVIHSVYGTGYLFSLDAD
jgi:DNA-binding response OmpR family regulator